MMVLHKQPQSLYSLTHHWVCSYIGDKLVNTGYDSPAQQTLATVRSANISSVASILSQVVLTSSDQKLKYFYYMIKVNLVAAIKPLFCALITEANNLGALSNFLPAASV